MDHIERVRLELKQIDGLLDVIEHPAFRRFALVARWPEAEPKWQLVQKGEMSADEAYDILGWFSEDMHDADTAPTDVALDNRVLDILRKCDNSQKPWRDRLRSISERNIAVRQKRKQEMVDQAEGIAKDLYYMSGHREAVHMERIMKDIIKEANQCQTN
jgi:hypothetical protein